MQVRKDPLVVGEYYHVFSQSIAGYIIFNNDNEFERFVDLLSLYRYEDFTYRYSDFIELEMSAQMAVRASLLGSEKNVEIIAFCLMPTHIHLILKQLTDNGISKFISKTLNSYSRCFNQRHKRNGPLWSGRFKSVLVKKNEQLLHLTRYIHLNPASAGLVSNPEEWIYSSYCDYLSDNPVKSFVNLEGRLDLNSSQYRKFVNDHKAYQRELSIIKGTLIDNYTE